MAPDSSSILAKTVGNPASLPHPAGFKAARAPGVIFIVDDEPIVTSSLEAILALDTDHEVHLFNSPYEALAALEATTPELILSDFVMPGLNGVEFLSQVRQRLPEVTCILLTGYADKENAIASINQVGIYRYMQKPWDNQELLLNIQNGLERARLLNNLRVSLQALEVAHQQLATYNEQLEDLVDERTLDLRQTYQKLHSIVHHTTDGIVTINSEGQLTSFNPAVGFWLQRQAIASGDVLGQALDTLLTLPSGQNAASLMEAAQSEIQFEAILGSQPLEVNMAPIFDGEGGYVLMLRDIAQRKESERLREDFVSTLTHDLRTPLLAAIQTFGFFLDGTLGNLSQKQNQLLSMLQDSHKDLLGLVNTLLEVYKYEAGRQTLVLDTLNLRQLAEQVVGELKSLAQKKEVTLRLVLQDAEASYRVKADRQELRRVLVNLVGNAIHHTPKNGLVELQLEKAGPLLQLHVNDTGVGIPAVDVPNLFKRFSQGTSKKRNSGTGLGLYLSRQIMEAHNGSIWVESTEGKGSRFSIELEALD